ncbi:MAG: cation:proton antiporter [Cyanobacteria bacterium J06621_8]
MSQTTIIWIALPFLIGFAVYLLPRLAFLSVSAIALVSAGYAGQVLLLQTSETIELLDNFGVSLLVDSLSGWFILTNALVTMAVAVYYRQSGNPSSPASQYFFFMQLIMLHGSVNAVFICADFMSLYVALEVISVAAFLLIAYPRSDRSIWVGLRYLFVSNTAMLFYLIGAVLVFKANNSWAYGGLVNAPPEAIALIIVGLLAKGGIFVSGFWLPLTHSESATPVSAMLSGVVVKAGVFPLVRCALMLQEIEPIVRVFGVATALLGVSYAVFERDTKRTLAFSTISQLGFILAAPVAGGFYALTHGLAKATLFLSAGNLPSRDFGVLRERGIDLKIWLAIATASLSICGFPLLSGFAAKVLASKDFSSWQAIAMNLATVGTVITLAKFIFLPRESPLSTAIETKDSPQVVSKRKKPSPGLWSAIIILLGGLIAGNIFYQEVYTLNNLLKPLLTLILGWLLYFLCFKRWHLSLPRESENFDHLIGAMSLVLILVFWMLQTNTAIASYF